MAKKVKTMIKLQLPAGKATPAPPVGTALGPHGINIAAGDTDNRRGAQIYVNLRGTGTIRGFVGQTSGIFWTTTTTYPPQYATMINMAIGSLGNAAPTQDDEVVGTYHARGLVVVGANISNNQVPVVFSGVPGKPAGLNGSRAV